MAEGGPSDDKEDSWYLEVAKSTGKIIGEILGTELEILVNDLEWLGIDPECLRIDREWLRRDRESLKEQQEEELYGPYAYELYRNALEDGIEEDSSIRINVVGNFGQGKTSLVNRLIGKDIDAIQSTDSIDISRYKCLRDQSGNITYTQNPGLDPSEIVKRIKAVSLPMEKESIKRERYIPKDLSRKERYKLIQAVKDTEEHTRSSDDIKRFDIWDFGGQYVFYATHTLFHSRKAIYLLVFNLTCGLTDIVKNDDEEGECCANRGQRTMEYYIRFWINSIHSFVGNEDGTEPKIILVGTHFDSLDGDDRLKQQKANQYFSRIRALFKGKQALKHIFHEDFHVDNKEVGNASFKALTDTILSVGQELAKSTIVPAKWIQLEKALFTRREEKIVEFENIAEIDKENEYPLGTAEQIKLFLKHQHDKGNVCFFEEEPISKYVVLDPQFLVDAFKCLITAKRFVKNMPDVFEAWHTFTNEGILEPMLMDKLWTNAQDKLLVTHRDTILWFLQKHGILSQAMRFQEKTQTAVGLGWYIVPSLLKEHSQETEIGEFLKEKNQTIVQFVISFDNSAVVPTVYHRLIAAVLGEWSVIEFRKKKLLFEDLSIVQIDSEHAGLIQLNDKHIQLSVLNLSPPRNVKGKIADEFRRFGESVIKNEFRKYKGVKDHNILPYVKGYACNHKSHIFGGKIIKAFGQELSIQSPTCPDYESHGIDTALAITQWFQGNEVLEFVSSENPSDRTLSKFSLVIGEDWEILGLSLGLRRVEIEQIRADNPTTAIRIYKMLFLWRDTFPDTASIRALVEELRNLQNLTVDWDGIRNIVDELNKSKRSGLAQ